MKKRNLFIAGIIAIVVVAIALTGIFYPSAFQIGAEGTIAKVEKYHKQQMSEADVLMRSKILNDTTKLKETINGLVMFNAFAEKMAENMDQTVATMRGSDLSGSQKMLQSMNEIRDYSTFIKNNNVTLDKTINLLVNHYQTKTTATSADIEQNLEEFSNYVYQISVKDSILDSFIDNCDEFIGDAQIFKTREKEIEGLKKVRDNLLLGNAQMAFVVGNNDKLQVILDKPLYNIESLGMGNASNIKNVVIANEDKLKAVCSSEQIKNMALNNDAVNAILYNADKNLGTIIFCDSDKLQQVVSNQVDLKGIVYSADELKNMLGNQSNQLNVILAQDGLRVLVLDKDNLRAINYSASLGQVLQAQNLALGILLCNEGSLQNVLSGNASLGRLLNIDATGNVATINSSGKLDRILAVGALQFSLAAAGNEALANCALNKSELNNVLKSNQALCYFLANQNLNLYVANSGTISAFGNQSLGLVIQANASLANLIANQIGNAYANKLNAILLDHPNLGVIIYNIGLENSGTLQSAVLSNVTGLQAVFNSFPSSLGVINSR